MSAGESDAATHRAIAAVWRIEAARLIAALTRVTRDVGIAEELAQDALVAALEQWPTRGIPQNPGAWLMSTARHRAIDLIRRNQRLAQKQDVLGRDLELQQELSGVDPDDRADEPIRDDMLRLIFIACHPLLSAEARVALTLRLLGGLTTDEIARAFLVPEATVAQGRTVTETLEIARDVARRLIEAPRERRGTTTREVVGDSLEIPLVVGS